jgi:uncharacterized protein YfaS (alpha-2-macroglobulin family)
VLASNLGVMVKGGGDGTMDVFVHNLLDTEPMKGVEVKFYNYQGYMLGGGETGSDGQAKVDIKAGVPFYLIASLDKQRAYVRMDKGSALSLSSFDVSGEVIQKGIKGFIYGDRGVWRPGDVLHIGFMLNDREGTMPDGYPVVMELYNPMGQIYLKKVTTSGILGVYAFDLPTESNVPTGSWTVKVTVGGATFTKAVRIESIKPNRLKINIASASDILLKGAAMDGNMHVEWLQGATARNMKYDIQGTFVSIPTSFKGLEKFCFDDPSKTFDSEEGNLITGRTDAAGNARLTPVFDTGSTAPGMLMASFTTKVYEESGDFSIDTKTMRYSPYANYVGILSPQQDEKPLSTGKSYMFQLASVDYKGAAAPHRSLSINIFKVSWYWWYNSDNSNLGQYISNSYNQPIRNMTVTTDARGRANLPLSFADNEWGTYFVQVTDNVSKHTTGVLSYFDMPFEGRRDADGAQSATMLSFKTDKDSYAPGDDITVTFPSSEGSRAIVTVENGTSVLSVTEQKCEAKETTVRLKATEEMQPNAYIYVTLLQPHAQTKNDLPIRLYGVVPVKVVSPDSRLTPVIRMANELKPQTKYDITVSEKNGQEMAYTLAVVDEGLLDLTHYKTPDPWSVFNAREALGVNTWDMYNYVLGAFGGRIEQIFSIGGDNALNKGPKAIVNRFTPVVQFIGPFHLAKGESKHHTLTMPNYYGRVRVMVVAGNGKAYGNAEQSVMVRKPVMVLGTLPRIIGVNEEMEVPCHRLRYPERCWCSEGKPQLFEQHDSDRRSHQDAVFQREGRPHHSVPHTGEGRYGCRTHPYHSSGQRRDVDLRREHRDTVRRHSASQGAGRHAGKGTDMAQRHPAAGSRRDEQAVPRSVDGRTAQLIEVPFIPAELSIRMPRANHLGRLPADIPEATRHADTRSATAGGEQREDMHQPSALVPDGRRRILLLAGRDKHQRMGHGICRPLPPRGRSQRLLCAERYEAQCHHEHGTHRPCMEACTGLQRTIGRAHAGLSPLRPRTDERS